MKYNKLQTTQLVKSFRNGDETAFNSLVNNYYDHFCKYVKIKFPSLEEDAGEIVDDSFLEFHEKPRQIKKPESFYSWLAQVIYHKCIHRKKQLKQSNELSNDMESSAPDPVEKLIYEAGEKIIHTILQTFFSNSNRLLLSNRYIEEMTHKESAESEIARIDEGKSNRSTVKQTEKNMGKRLYNKTNAIKTQVNDLKKTLAALLLAYSDTYFEKFLTDEEIGVRLDLPVTEVEKRLSSACNQFWEHLQKQLSPEEREMLKLRSGDKESPKGKDFQTISEEKGEENLKVQKQWYDAKTELENELSKMGITNTIKDRILIRDEKMAKKRKGSA